MLGADGERSYLLLIQDNAEIRATGGIPGAFAELRTDGGRLELGLRARAGREHDADVEGAHRPRPAVGRPPRRHARLAAGERVRPRPVGPRLTAGVDHSGR